MALDAPFRGVLVGQLQRRAALHVTTCEAALPAQQWRRLRFSYGSNDVEVVAYDAADTKVVSITSRGTVYVHSVFDPNPLQVIETGLVLHCVALSQDSHRYICAGSDSGHVQIWNAFNSQRFTSYDAHGDVAARKIAINSDDSYVASCSERAVVVYSLILSKIVFDVAHTSVTSLTFSSLRKYLLCATDDRGSVVVYDVKAKGVLVRFDHAHDAPVTGAAFSPTNKVFFVSCGLDRFVSFYDIGANLKIGTRIQAEAPLTAVQFAANGASVVVTDSSFQTIVYDLRSTSQPLMKFAGAFACLLKYVSLPIHQVPESDAIGNGTSPESALSSSLPSTSSSSSFFSPIRTSGRTSPFEQLPHPGPGLEGTSSALFSPVRAAAAQKPLKPVPSVARLSGSDSSRIDYHGQFHSAGQSRDQGRDEGSGDLENMSAVARSSSSLFSPIQPKKGSDSTVDRPGKAAVKSMLAPSSETAAGRISALSAQLHNSFRLKIGEMDRDSVLSESVNSEAPSYEAAESPLNKGSCKRRSYGNLSADIDEEQQSLYKNGPTNQNLNILEDQQIGLKDQQIGLEKASDFGSISEESLGDSRKGNDCLSNPVGPLSASQIRTEPESKHEPVEGEPVKFPLGPVDHSMRPSGNSIQAEVIRSALDESITAIRNDVRNLHLDMVRCFHRQKVELALQFNAEIEHLKHNFAQVVAENHKLRQQIERFGPFPDIRLTKDSSHEFDNKA